MNFRSLRHFKLNLAICDSAFSFMMDFSFAIIFVNSYSNMMPVVNFAFLQLFVTCKSGGLPQWVYRVDSCPDSNNISQWIAASKRLNCYNNLISNDPNEQVRVYHCVPSSFLNETVEFCGRSIPISPGNCPVYSNRPTISPIECSNFVFGCPLKLFHSKEVYRCK